jgi:hypothetical protein
MANKEVEVEQKTERAKAIGIQRENLETNQKLTISNTFVVCYAG